MTAMAILPRRMTTSVLFSMLNLLALGARIEARIFQHPAKVDNHLGVNVLAMWMVKHFSFLT
jgi:hypothetical protein